MYLHYKFHSVSSSTSYSARSGSTDSFLSDICFRHSFLLFGIFVASAANVVTTTEPRSQRNEAIQNQIHFAFLKFYDQMQHTRRRCRHHMSNECNTTSSVAAAAANLNPIVSVVLFIHLFLPHPLPSSSSYFSWRAREWTDWGKRWMKCRSRGAHMKSEMLQ